MPTLETFVKYRLLAPWLLGLLTSGMLASAPLAGAAEPPEAPPRQSVTLPDTQEFTLKSARGEGYRILVSVPPGAPPAQGYGTLVVLDGNAYFGAYTQAMRMLLAFPEFVHDGRKTRAEPTLVVGIAYPGDPVLDGPRRSWDFLPPARNPASVKRLRGPEPGGADDFMDFLTGSLRPALAARYPLHDDRHTLAGHSLGGYFVLHALAHRPASFQRYVALSPSIWWDAGRVIADLAQARIADRQVLLAVAQDEGPGYPDYSALMLEGARAARDALLRQGLAPATLRYLEMPFEDHMTMPFALAPAAVRYAALP